MRASRRMLNYGNTRPAGWFHREAISAATPRPVSFETHARALSKATGSPFPGFMSSARGLAGDPRVDVTSRRGNGAMARAQSARHEPSSKAVVYVALVGNLLVAVTKFVAAGFSGSSSM